MVDQTKGSTSFPRHENTNIRIYLYHRISIRKISWTNLLLWFRAQVAMISLTNWIHKTNLEGQDYILRDRQTLRTIKKLMVILGGHRGHLILSEALLRLIKVVALWTGDIKIKSRHHKEAVQSHTFRKTKQDLATKAMASHRAEQPIRIRLWRVVSSPGLRANMVTGISQLRIVQPSTRPKETDPNRECPAANLQQLLRVNKCPVMISWRYSVAARTTWQWSRI